jgi:hypothetical protein
MLNEPAPLSNCLDREPRTDGRSCGQHGVAESAREGFPRASGIRPIGAAVLGLVIAYGIMRNRTRTRAEKHITDQATKNNYAEENRDRVSH